MPCGLIHFREPGIDRGFKCSKCARGRRWQNRCCFCVRSGTDASAIPLLALMRFGAHIFPLAESHIDELVRAAAAEAVAVVTKEGLEIRYSRLGFDEHKPGAVNLSFDWLLALSPASTRTTICLPSSSIEVTAVQDASACDVDSCWSICIASCASDFIGNSMRDGMSLCIYVRYSSGNRTECSPHRARF